MTGSTEIIARNGLRRLSIRRSVIVRNCSAQPPPPSQPPDTQKVPQGGTFHLETRCVTQYPKQSETVGLQQMPPAQTCPSGHVWLQPPQLRGSDRTSTHTPPHTVPGQTHVPELQYGAVAGHTFPQAP